MKKSTTKVESGLTRREFIGAAAAATAFTIVPRHVLGGLGHTPPSDKLNIAGVGVGGQGYYSVMNVSSENIVALCDVDHERASAALKWFPKARRYHDFRRMLDKEHKHIDAVVVTTPTHTHLPVAAAAMKMGKHVFSEKPLGHNIREVRMVAELAEETGLATQMGSGGHSGDNYHRVVELVRAGVIGDIAEVHIWCDNEWDPLPRVVTDELLYGDRQRPGIPVPKHLRWDLWLGPAPYRPYNPTYHPRHWRDWWDFANGRFGDMGPHFLDLPFWALDLKYPLTAEAEGPARVGRETTPPWLIARWTFPRRGDLPPVTLTWYDGNKRPDMPKEVNPPDWDIGILFVGSKGMILSDYTRHELHPKEKFADFQRPPETIPRGRWAQDWIAACKSSDPAMRNFAGNPGLGSFDYAGPLTETTILGTVAYRLGKKLQWDPVNLKATNCPEAGRFIGRECRKGWAL